MNDERDDTRLARCEWTGLVHLALSLGVLYVAGAVLLRLVGAI